MHMKDHAGGSTQVDQGQYSYQDFFHGSYKVTTKMRDGK